MAALITRCPACATMFKVVPDQLRVSEGWVRCGHCGEIFDASAHLQQSIDVAPAAPVPDPAAEPRVAQAPAARSDAVPDEGELPSDPGSELPSQLGSELPADISSLHSEFNEAAVGQEPDPDELAAQARTLVEDPLDQPFALRREDLSRTAEAAPSHFEPAAGASENDSEFDSAAPLADEPAFVRQARRQARWHHPAVRALLALAAFALAALLVLQVGVQERDRLAASQPQLRPWLAGLCGQIGCRIAPPRQIDAISIDSSSFNKLRPDAYRLQVTLKNQARTEVAMPALELTLTDNDEQPLVRRVLLPREFVPGHASIAAASDWSGAVAVAVVDNSLASRVAGYRLLAFYP